MKTLSKLSLVAENLLKFFGLIKNSDLLSETEKKLITEHAPVIDKVLARSNEKTITALLVGETNAGKSSFVNAMLQADVCAEAAITSTNCLTFLKYGEKEKAIIYTSDDQYEEIPLSDLPRFQTEAANKGNAKEVVCIEVFLRNNVLKTGLILVDSPGLGSRHPMHDLITARAAESSDVIFFFSPSTREISASQAQGLRNVLSHSKTKNMVPVISMADQGDPEAIADQNLKVLASVLPEDTRLFPMVAISSVMYNEYQKTKNELDLEASGFTSMVETLNDISSQKEPILVDALLIDVLPVVSGIQKLIDDWYTAAADPAVADRLSEKQKEVADRIQDIIDNSDSWKITLSGDLKYLQTDVNAHRSNALEEMYAYIEKSIDNKVDSDVIAKELMNKLMEFNDKHAGKIDKGVLSVYMHLKEDSGLANLQKANDYRAPIKIEPLDPYKPEGGLAEVLNNARTYLSLTVGTGLLGVTVGSAISSGASALAAAKVGATAGTAGGPAGMIIGGCAGALLGFVSAAFYSKKQQRAEQKKAFKEEVGKAFRKITENDNKLFIKVETDILKAFSRELKAELKYAQELAKQFAAIATKDASFKGYLDAIRKEFKTSVENILKELTE